MKKTLVVLLITVLAAGFAFASFSGSAQIGFGVNADKKTWGFSNTPKLTVKWSGNLNEGTGASAGEGDLRAEIEASFEFAFEYEAKDKPFLDEAVFAYGTLVSASISKANIIYKDFTFGILNAGGGYSYATAYYDTDSDGNKDDALAMRSKSAPGFTASYDGYTVGLGLTGGEDAYTVFANGQTKAFELSEGLTAQAAGYAFMDKALGKDFGAAAKVAYTSDALTADAAFDFLFVDKETMGLEVAANASYAPVTVNAYYLNATDLLDAKAAVKFENGNAYVDFRNILKDGRSLTVGGKLVIDAITVEGSVKYPFKFEKGIDSVMVAKASVAYKAEKFTAQAGATVEARPVPPIVPDELDVKVTKISPSASIESKAIINNCKLSLGWSGSNFVKWEYKAKKTENGVTTPSSLKKVEKALIGAISATATISF